MFIEAIADMAHIDMLFYVPAANILSGREILEIERKVSQHWNASINLYFCPLAEREEPLPRWHVYGSGVLSLFRQMKFYNISGPEQVSAFHKCLSLNPDAIFVHRLPCMCPVLLSRKKTPPVLFDLDDIEHVAYCRRIRMSPMARSKYLFYFQLPALLWGERRAVKLSKRTFVCSEADEKYLSKTWRFPNVVTVPNAVDIPETHTMEGKLEGTLAFIGVLGYHPNRVAAEFLVEEVFPLVRQSIPDAKLVIVGKRPERVRGYNAGIPGVEFTGFVDDIHRVYSRSQVVCAPVFSGGGTRVKIIEAAAFGKPVVANRMGAEGLHMNDGKDILLREDPVSFAKACVELLRNHDLRLRIGSMARNTAIKYYDRRNIVKSIKQLIADCLSSPG